MTNPTTQERILDAAERLARRTGYHGFSFRDVAAEVGVKSASIHHHFPTKADLGETLARRYTERAARTLGAPTSFADAVARVTSLFRASLEVEDRMCLCGMLGAERDALPPGVAVETARYFRMLRSYLDGAPGADTASVSSETVIAALEGALILARSLGEAGAFETVADDLARRC